MFNLRKLYIKSPMLARILRPTQKICVTHFRIASIVCGLSAKAKPGDIYQSLNILHSDNLYLYRNNNHSANHWAVEPGLKMVSIAHN